jgi:AraC family transcriptional regulator, transcriptional activator of pobA
MHAAALDGMEASRCVLDKSNIETVMPTTAIPAYWLYGEGKTGRFPDALHIETITVRSALHDWTIEPHRHQDLFQFFLIVAGGGRTRIDGHEHRLEPGSAILLPPLTIHEFAFVDGTDGFVASIAEATLRRLFAREPEAASCLAQPVLLAPDEAAQRPISALLRAAHDEFGGNLTGRDPALSAHAELIALWFAREARRHRAVRESPQDASAILVRRFLEQVENHFREQRPLTAYARELNVSVPHLSRCCRSVLGHAAARVIQDRLMIEARRDLVYTSSPVSQISFRLGFGDPAYFSRFFAARAGMPPSAYRAGA